MALLVWLPLNGNLDNLGLYSININSSAFTSNNNGKIGSCIKCSTSASIDTGVPASVWDFTTKSISFGAWVKINLTELAEVTSTSTYSGNYTTAGGNLLGRCSYGGLGLRWKTNNLTSDTTPTTVNLYVYIRNTTSGSRLTSNVNLPFDTWTHIFVIFNRENKTMTIYKNGLPQSSVSVAMSTYASTGNISQGTFLINHASWDGGNGNAKYAPWYINDVRIYDHALSSKEVHEIAKGLVLHYPLSRNTGLDNLITNSVNIENNLPFNDSDYTNRGAYVRLPTNTNTVVLTLTGLFNAYRWYHSQLSITVLELLTPGQPWVFSMEVKSDDVQGTMALWMNIRKTNNLDVASPNVISNSNYTTPIPSIWTKYYVSITPRDVDSERVWLLVGVSGTSTTSGTIQFRNLKFEKGTIPTTWCPSKTELLGIDMRLNEGAVKDCSGYNNNPISETNIDYSTDTFRYMCSAVFNGTSYITMNSIGSILTMSAWFKTTKSKSTSLMICCDKASLMCISIYSGTIIGYYGLAGSLDTGSKCTLGSSYKENDWNHVVVIKTGVGTRDIYCNGIKLTPTSNDYWGAATNGAYIGTRNYSSSPIYFYGYLSDIRFYTTILSELDILELYNTSALIDNKGNGYSYEFDEISKNLFTLENWNEGCKTTLSYVNRNGSPSIPLNPAQFYYGSGDSRNLQFQTKFAPNTLYKFDLWIDADDAYNSVANKNVEGGIRIYYTDGTSAEYTVLTNIGNRDNPIGWVHKVYYSTPGKSISGIGVHYNVAINVYYRWDSMIIPIESTTEIKNNGIMSTGSFRENVDIALICEGDNFDTNQLIEI